MLLRRAADSMRRALFLTSCAALLAFTCGSGWEARRDSAARTARTPRTNPHHLILTLQTDDLVVLVVFHLAAAHVLTPGVDLHACVDLTDQSHVGSSLMIQHPPHRRRSHLLRMGSAWGGINLSCIANIINPTYSNLSSALTSAPSCQPLSARVSG